LLNAIIYKGDEMHKLAMSLIVAIALAGGVKAGHEYENAFATTARIHDSASALEIGTVRSEGDGVVELYEFHGGEMGKLIGSKSVRAGANSNVRIPVQTHVRGDVMALLRVDGNVLASHWFHNAD
jgi:hypothetical protein